MRGRQRRRYPRCGQRDKQLRGLWVSRPNPPLTFVPPPEDDNTKLCSRAAAHHFRTPFLIVAARVPAGRNEKHPQSVPRWFEQRGQSITRTAAKPPTGPLPAERSIRMTTETEHMSPQACSRCNPFECICACHHRAKATKRAAPMCHLLGHKFYASHRMLDPAPEQFDFCLRCGKQYDKAGRL